MNKDSPNYENTPRLIIGPPHVKKRGAFTPDTYPDYLALLKGEIDVDEYCKRVEAAVAEAHHRSNDRRWIFWSGKRNQS